MIKQNRKKNEFSSTRDKPYIVRLARKWGEESPPGQTHFDEVFWKRISGADQNRVDSHSESRKVIFYLNCKRRQLSKLTNGRFSKYTYNSFSFKMIVHTMHDISLLRIHRINPYRIGFSRQKALYLKLCAQDSILVEIQILMTSRDGMKNRLKHRILWYSTSSKCQ